MIHFGQMKCGKCDQFGDLFHVVSDFFHVNFVPLIPLRSHLVLQDAPSNADPLPIPLSLKSVLVAWIRTGLVLLILACSIAVLRSGWHFLMGPGLRRPGLAGRPEVLLEDVLNPLWLVIGFVIFFALTYRFSRAGWTRALHLGSRIGLTEEDLESHLHRARSRAHSPETLDPAPE